MNAQDKRQLKLIGLWVPLDPIPAHPAWLHPMLLVDENWELEHRDQIVEYLECCPVLGHWCGLLGRGQRNAIMGQIAMAERADSIRLYRRGWKRGERLG